MSSELSEYELQRRMNILSNEQKLTDLGLTATNSSNVSEQKRAARKKKPRDEPFQPERVAVPRKAKRKALQVIAEVQGVQETKQPTVRTMQDKDEEARRILEANFQGADVCMLYNLLPRKGEEELLRIVEEAFRSGKDPATDLCEFKEKWRGVPKEGSTVAAKLNVGDEEVVVPVLIVGEDSMWKRYVDDLNAYIDMTGKDHYICTTSSTIHYRYPVYDEYCCLGLTEKDYQLQFILKEDVCDHMRMQWKRDVFVEFKHRLNYCSLIAAIRCDTMLGEKFDHATQRHDEVFRETKEMFDRYKPFKLIQDATGESGDETHEQLVASYADDGMIERIEDKDAALFLRLKYRLDGEHGDEIDLLWASSLDADYDKREERTSLPTEPIYRPAKRGRTWNHQRK